MTVTNKYIGWIHCHAEFDAHVQWQHLLCGGQMVHGSERVESNVNIMPCLPSYTLYN